MHSLSPFSSLSLLFTLFFFLTQFEGGVCYIHRECKALWGKMCLWTCACTIEFGWFDLKCLSQSHKLREPQSKLGVFGSQLCVLCVQGRNDEAPHLDSSGVAVGNALLLKKKKPMCAHLSATQGVCDCSRHAQLSVWRGVIQAWLCCMTKSDPLCSHKPCTNAEPHSLTHTQVFVNLPW